MRVVVMVAVVAVLVAGCASDEDPATSTSTTATPAADSTPATQASAASGGSVSLAIREPAALAPLDVVESEGIAVARAVFTTLITYDPQTSEPAPGVADAITTDDGGTTWTITLRPGWTFHNGEPVTASSFVDAWHAGAYGPNAHETAGFFADIAGFAALNPADPDVEPELQELSGLREIDELTFEVTLTEQQPTWSDKLGYPAFAPLPQAYFDDPAQYAEQPIGNGPFRLTEPWQHNEYIRVERWSDWPGDPAPTVDELEFAIYADVQTAVLDLLAGNLDVVVDVPAAQWPDVRQQLGAEQTQSAATASVTFLGFPLAEGRFGGEAGRTLRTALSLALDQEAITDAIFAGTELPAANLLPPGMPGHEEEVCSAWGTDQQRAQELFAEVGPLDGPLTVWFNSGSGQQEWIEAAAAQWRTVLGIEDVTFESLRPADYLPRVAGGEVTGPFRLGWSMDYPSPQTFLEPLLASWQLPDQGGANVFRYTDEEYDGALREALARTDDNEAISAFQKAVRIACEDVPLIPVYYGQSLTAHSEDVAGVQVDAFGHVDYLRLTTTG